MRRALALILPLVVSLLLAGCSSESAVDPFDPGPAIEPILADLEGLDLDDFYAESLKELTLRSPEFVTELGLDAFYGTPGDRLDNICDAYVKNTQKLTAGVLDLLHGYDRESLDAAGQVSYDVYDWYLQDVVRSHRFMYHNYPASYRLSSVHNWTTMFFTDIQPVTSRQDADNYVARLRQVDTKFQQLLEGLRLREEAGVIPPRFVTEWSLYGVQQTTATAARSQPVYTVFQQKLAGVAELSDDDRANLLSEAEDAIEESYLPAFRGLEAYLETLEGKGSDDDGVWQHPDGEAHYEYLMRHYTTTERTADEIHAQGLEEVERLRAELRERFDLLGYPQDETLTELFDRVATDGGYVEGDAVVDTYRAIIDEAEANLDTAFDVFPGHEVVVIGGDSGGFYIPGALDGSRPGAFYANASGAPEPRYAMASLAYHEAVPGHHFQITIAQELDLPAHRTGLSFTVYSEGWALYAERLAHDLGWYDGDAYGDLGRLQYEIFRAARLVVDTGIHAKRWTFAEAQAYLEENVGFDPVVLNLEYQVARYIALPGQALAYMTGMLELLALRQQAQDELGAAYDLKAFHRAALTGGSLPLPILKRVIEDYIAANR